jgi:AAA+ ATPase superfamily predicted ATPase
MNKAIIMAKIKRQQAELGEIIAEISKDRRLNSILQILEVRYKETEQLLDALGDKSYIPKGIEDLDALDEIKMTEKKIGKIKTSIKKMKKLDKEKKKIEKKLK